MHGKACQFFGDFYQEKWVLDCSEFHEESKGIVVAEDMASNGQRSPFSPTAPKFTTLALTCLSSSYAAVTGIQVSVAPCHDGVTHVGQLTVKHDKWGSPVARREKEKKKWRERERESRDGGKRDLSEMI